MKSTKESTKIVCHIVQSTKTKFVVLKFGNITILENKYATIFIFNFLFRNEKVKNYLLLAN